MTPTPRGGGSGITGATGDLPGHGPGSAAPACGWHEGLAPGLCRYRAANPFFTSTLELDELVQAAAAFVHGLVRAETVRVWLLRRGGQRLVSREFDPASPGSMSER